MKHKLNEYEIEYCPICGNIMNPGDDICDDCLSRDAEGYGTLEERFGLLEGDE